MCGPIGSRQPYGMGKARRHRRNQPPAGARPGMDGTPPGAQPCCWPHAIPAAVAAQNRATDTNPANAVPAPDPRHAARTGRFRPECAGSRPGRCPGTAAPARSARRCRPLTTPRFSATAPGTAAHPRRRRHSPFVPSSHSHILTSGFLVTELHSQFKPSAATPWLRHTITAIPCSALQLRF